MRRISASLAMCLIIASACGGGTSTAPSSQPSTAPSVAPSTAASQEPTESETPDLTGQSLVIAGYGGVWTETTHKFFSAPFQEATGAEVTDVSVPDPGAGIIQQGESGQIQWDILDGVLLDALEDKGLLEHLPQWLMDEVAKYAPPEDVVNNGILGYGDTATIIACNPEVVTKCPTNMDEFWDIAGFPGPRAMDGTAASGPMIAALIADGATEAEINEPDIERAIAKLNEIKASVDVYTQSGDQQMQVMRDKQVGISLMWNGRAFNLVKEMPEVQLFWDQCMVGKGGIAIPKGAPNKETAFQFLSWWIRQAEEQAGWTEALSYPTPNKDVVGLLPAELAASMPAAHDCAVVNGLWFIQHSDEVQQAWQEYLAGG